MRKEYKDLNWKNWEGAPFEIPWRTAATLKWAF
jgi:hypothetical protein